MATSKSSLQNVLSSVLSVGNSEQNFAYPPSVFSNHINIVSSFILDQLVVLYPAYLDALLPFLKTEAIAITDGFIKLPDDYRNIIGAPSISVKPDGSDCSGNNPVIIDTKSEFKTANLKAGCKTVPLRIVDKREWDALTTSGYAFPTVNEPIGFFDGEKKIKVCPYDLPRVSLTYIKKEKEYRYGYIVQPDDTFIFDEATSVESEWEEAAFSLLFKGCLALYSAYSRDSAITEYSMILNKAGLF